MNSFLAQSAHAIRKRPIFRPGSTQFYHATSAYVGCAAWLRRNDFHHHRYGSIGTLLMSAQASIESAELECRYTAPCPFPLAAASATARVIGAAAGHLGTCCYEPPLLREARDDGSDWSCGLGATCKCRPLVIGFVERESGGPSIRSPMSFTPRRHGHPDNEGTATRQKAQHGLRGMRQFLSMIMPP